MGPGGGQVRRGDRGGLGHLASSDQLGKAVDHQLGFFLFGCTASLSGWRDQLYQHPVGGEGRQLEGTVNVAASLNQHPAFWEEGDSCCPFTQQPAHGRWRQQMGPVLLMVDGGSWGGLLVFYCCP